MNRNLILLQAFNDYCLNCYFRVRFQVEKRNRLLVKQLVDSRAPEELAK